MYQTFSFNRIHMTLINTNDEVQMNAARYQARVNKSRALSIIDGSTMKDAVVKFSQIMAHVVEADGFPFAVPDPYAHPETVGLAWDAFMTEAPDFWDQLLTAIDIPAMISDDLLQDAMAEMDAVSAHHVSPFKRKQNMKDRK